MWEVQTKFVSGFENCWTDENGDPVTFATKIKAESAMIEYLMDSYRAYRDGITEEPPVIADYRVREVLTTEGSID